MEALDPGQLGTALRGSRPARGSRTSGRPRPATARRCGPAGGPGAAVGSGRWPRATWGPNGTIRPFPPLPRRTTASPRVTSTSSALSPITSPARSPVSIISRATASSRRSAKPLPWHALISAGALLVGQPLDDLGVELRRREPHQRVGVEQRPPRPATRRTAAATSGGCGRWPVPLRRASRSATQLRTRARSSTGVPIVGAPGQERPRAGGVRVDGGGDLRSAVQGECPARQQPGEVDVHHRIC